MSRRAWSPAAEEKLAKLYATTPLPRLAFLLKRTETAVRSRAKLLGLQKGNRRPWSKADDRALRKRYPHENTSGIARDLGRTPSQVYRRAGQLDLHKSADFMESDRSGRIQRGRTDPRMVAGQFQKGIVPWNSGTKGVSGTHPNCRRTQFRKGMPAHEKANYRPIGSEKICRDGYLTRKITDDPKLVPARRWEAVHRLVWIEANGPIPPRHVVRFRAGMRTTDPALITVDRLELVTINENMRRNSLHNNYPKEVVEIIQLRGALNRKINQKIKEATAHEEQNV